MHIQHYNIRTRVCCSLGVHSSVRVMHIRLPEQPVGLGARRVGGGVASSPPRPPRVLQIHAERHAHLCACVCMCMYMCVCVCKREREKGRGGSMFVSWGGASLWAIASGVYRWVGGKEHTRSMMHSLACTKCFATLRKLQVCPGYTWKCCVREIHHHGVVVVVVVVVVGEARLHPCVESINNNTDE